MIKKETVFIFSCDVCKMSQEKFYTDSAKKASKEILNYGWKTQRKDRKNTHICPYCVEKSQENRKKTQKTQQKPFYIANVYGNYSDYYKNSLISQEIFQEFKKNYSDYINQKYYDQFSKDYIKWPLNSYGIMP